MGDSQGGLTVKEAAALIRVHPQTVRRYIKEGKVDAEKTQGSYGPEWRIKRESAESMRGEVGGEGRGDEQALSDMHSMLVAIESRLREIEGGQKALMPSDEELEARRDRQERVAGALGEQAGRVEELVRENERLRAENERLEQELRDARRSWWDRVFGSGVGGTEV